MRDLDLDDILLVCWASIRQRSWNESTVQSNSLCDSSETQLGLRKSHWTR